ncbi:hypothetical protein [Priestia megaterium]|uniref:hypothetical protein n=1 Tax=Priestia megaterium TaxID=1404 RepID=UPI0039FD8CA4
MSKSNSSFKIPDPFIMTPDKVTEIVYKYLSENGFMVTRGSSNSDVDVRAKKNSYELIIESRGNQAYKNRGTDKVFDGSQIDIHLSEHITQIMRFQQIISSDCEPIFIMANPLIPRIVQKVEKYSKALDKLEIIRLWLDIDETLMVQCQEELQNKIANILCLNSLAKRL